MIKNYLLLMQGLFVIFSLAMPLSASAEADESSPNFMGPPNPVVCSISQSCRYFVEVTRDSRIVTCDPYDPGTGRFEVCNNSPAAQQARVMISQTSNFMPSHLNSQTRSLTGASNGETDETSGASPSGTAADMAGDGCEAFDEGIQSCQVEHDSAISRCDDKNDPDMASAGQAATMAANAVSTATSASMQMACSKMKDVSMTMQAALTGFKAACESARSSCVSSCGAAANDINNYPQCAHRKSLISKQLSDCKKLDNQMAQINYGLQTMMATHLNAKQCANMSVADNKDFCKTNPTSPICKTENVNCNDPKLSATNPVCICMNNPHDPVCGGGGSRASAANSYGVNGSGGAGVNGKLGGMGSTSSLGSLMGGKGANGPFGEGGNPGDPGVGKGSNPVEAGNGGGGRGLAGGGSGGGSGVGGYGDSGSTGYRGGKGSTSGFYGGGGTMSAGGGGGYGSGSGGGGGSGYYGSNPQYRNQDSGKPEAQVDLRQFLPKSRPNMMLGMTGPDGITGPTSDIWTKINFRYMSIRPSMRP